MQIVIDIPDEVYQDIQARDWKNPIWARDSLMRYIHEGVVLPKHHGRLIDADAFIAKLEDVSKRQKYKELLIDEFLTVDDVFKAVIKSLRNEGLAEGDAPTVIKATEEVD